MLFRKRISHHGPYTMQFINYLLYKISHWYFSKDALPYWCVLLYDCLVVIGTGVICHALEKGIVDTADNILPLLGTLCFYLLFYLVGFRIFRTYSGVIRFTTFTDIHRIALANLIGITSIACLRWFFHVDTWLTPIRMRELFYSFIMTTGVMWLTRLTVRFLFEYYRDNRKAKHIFIYGTKEGGISIARALSAEKNSYRIEGFFSESPHYMSGRILMGVKVYDSSDMVTTMKKNHATALFVSPLKQNDFLKNQEIVDSLINAGITLYTMGTAMTWDGKSALKASQLKEVEIEDLLPRDEIQVDMEQVKQQLHGECVLITGSAGSIGLEIVKQIARCQPRMMVLVDQAETPQHDVRLMMEKEYADVKAVTIVTSICNERRMEDIFRHYKPDYVFHAAAYKHVPMMEDNPSESIHNNVYGTKNIADLAVKYHVKKFVMISTDKAVNPTNVMGCSKRICEIYVQSLDRAIKGKEVTGITQFVTTRFGNVLGSNGSVIPLFKEQIRNGGPVTVTDPNIIRYFMLIPEACKLVLEAGTRGKGGEIFIFDMGQPVKIADRAKRMSALRGAQNVNIGFTGLRPGETLYEEVLNAEEKTKPSFHEKIRIASVREYDYSDVCKQLDELFAIARRYDDMETVRKMKDIVPEFKSRNSVYEQLDAS